MTKPKRRGPVLGGRGRMSTRSISDVVLWDEIMALRDRVAALEARPITAPGVWPSTGTGTYPPVIPTTWCGTSGGAK